MVTVFLGVFDGVILFKPFHDVGDVPVFLNEFGWLLSKKVIAKFETALMTVLETNMSLCLGAL